MSRYFAEIDANALVTRVIVADSLEWCQQALGGTWIETADPYSPEPQEVTYCGPGFGADPTFPERFAPPWVMPAPDPVTGVWSSFAKGDVRFHLGHLWKSTVSGNVWIPGESGWHPYPDIEGVRPRWIQPTGAHDTWANGVEVEREIDSVLRYFRSGIPNNATIPGDPSSGPPWNYWIEIDVNGEVIVPPAPPVAPWTQGGGTGVAGSYNLGDQVTHDNPNDGGNIWLYQSAIAANTTQPGRDGTFNRWWTPIERVE
jgi:hypothetical protein